ncbi:unnamed protein product [Hydatigera taeniaeformis]|uniref:DAGKc domain-containing protein n=1 Tax=Hydatigena taeniaeformis TaxID=6205 RepID=A0A0R3X107_HYDTA|nr:unnamed protein product [Hydatigera taeniaeformis]
MRFGAWKIQAWNVLGDSEEINSWYNQIQLCCELSVTTHQGHCKNFILMEDLQSYDGVVAVGGDGLFSEVLHGLLYRARTDAKLPLYKQHKPFSLEVTPRLRVGLIPAGKDTVLGATLCLWHLREVSGTSNAQPWFVLMDKFNDYVSAEYLLENTPDKLRAIYGDARVKTAGLKTGCRIEVTKRVLRRLVSPGNWTRLSILRVTGPDDQSIAQFNRLIEACIPIHSNRREYPRRASLTLLARPPTLAESRFARGSPQSYLQMSPVQRYADTPSAASNHLNDCFQSCDQKAGSGSREFGVSASKEHAHSGSVSCNNTPQSRSETVALSRKTASHSRSEATPKPKPRGLYRRLNDSCLLSSPPKEMVIAHKRMAASHRSRPESSGISLHLSEKHRNRDLSVSDRTTLNDVTSVITDPATGLGYLRRSNVRNASTLPNSKRLHLSRSKIYELEHHPTQELGSDSPRKPRRPRSLGARNRVQSSSDILFGVKREVSHRSKSPTKKEIKDAPQALAPLGNLSVRTRLRKSKRSRKSPLPERIITHSTSPHDILTSDYHEWGKVKSAKRTPSISPYKLSEKVRHESRSLNKMAVIVDNGGKDFAEPDGNTHGMKSTTSEYLSESRSQANRTTESSVGREVHADFGGISESIDQTSKSHLDHKTDVVPNLGTPRAHLPVSPTLIDELEMLDSSIDLVSVIQNKNLNPTIENYSDLHQLVEHEKYVTTSVADILQMDFSTVASTSMNDTGALTPPPSTSLNSNKIKGTTGSLVYKSAAGTGTTRYHLDEHFENNLDNQPELLIPNNRETTGVPSLEQLAEFSENGRPASYLNDFSAGRKFLHGTEVLMTVSPAAILLFAKDEAIDLPCGILSLLQFPEYEEGTTVRVETRQRVCHLVEHVISVLSEEAMPSPMSTYGINYSNAELDWNRSGDLLKFKPLSSLACCTANVTTISEMLPTHSEALKDSVLIHSLGNSQCLSSDSCMNIKDVMGSTELARGNPGCEDVDDRPNCACGLGMSKRMDVVEDSGFCTEISGRHESLPTPPSECQLLILPCVDDAVDQTQFLPPPPSPNSELAKCDDHGFSKNVENCEDVSRKQPPDTDILNTCDGVCLPENCHSASTPLFQKEIDENACTVGMRNAIQNRIDNVVEGASFSINRDALEGATSSLASFSIKLNSPSSSSPKQVVIQTSLLNTKNNLKSPGHNSLPSSTSSIPLDLPVPSGPECDLMQLRQPKQDRRIKSAGASPLHFDVLIDISAPRSAQYHGNNSFGLPQNCHASTVVSVDLDDVGTQENTHNATELSNRGRMESPISITLITELQGEGCGTSTLESFFRVAVPFKAKFFQNVLGFDIGVDVLGIHDASTKAFLRYTVSLLGYGFHGDILEPSERLRWLGPPRYDFAGAIKWLKLACYKCRIAYLPSTSSTPFDEKICVASCPICLASDGDHEGNAWTVRAGLPMTSSEVRQADGPGIQTHPTTSSLVDSPTLCFHPPHTSSVHPNLSAQNNLSAEVTEKRNDSLGEEGEESESQEKGLTTRWQVIVGDFVAVNAFLISCRCAKSPLGPAPAAHLGDGFLDLVLVRRCSRMKYLRYLVKLTNRHWKRKSEHLQMPFVEAYRVRAFHFEALNRYGCPVAPDETVGEDTSVWCVDGEVLCNPNIICWCVRVHFLLSSLISL